jgi:hypothetical protein
MDPLPRQTIDLPCRICGDIATVWLDEATYRVSANETRVARTCICPACRIEYGRRMDAAACIARRQATGWRVPR